jgi:integrase
VKPSTLGARTLIGGSDEGREKAGEPLLPAITPRSLRHTWATLAAEAGHDPRWISDQIGHTSAAFTSQIYQQTRKPTRQVVWDPMRFADEAPGAPSRAKQRGAPAES